jgi:SynChlorMet cassette protein ScmC
MGYLLELADGESWVFTASDEAAAWLDRFASITGLKQSDDINRKMVLVTHSGSGITSGAPKLEIIAGRKLAPDGWVQGHSRHSNYYMHRESLDIVYETGLHDAKNREFSSMWSLLLVIYSQVQHHGGFPLHAALIEKNGRGVALCARGDTGKTTCCNRVPPPWRAWCDDETLIVRTGARQYAAHAFPTWSEYNMGIAQNTWEVQQSIPLSAVVFLEQSETDELIPLRKAQAAVTLNHFLTAMNYALTLKMNREQLRAAHETMFEIVSQLAQVVPVYKLRVSLNGKFWEELEKIDGMT